MGKSDAFRNRSAEPKCLMLVRDLKQIILKLSHGTAIIRIPLGRLQSDMHISV